MHSRRKFIQNTALLSAGVSLLPGLSEALASGQKTKKIKIADNAVILFQGDSITDASREKTISDANNIKALGSGYVANVASQLLFDHPDKKLKIYNRGISGNKVYQLADRWDTDCIQLKPDVLSIMVGVNDFWHTMTHDYKGTITTYRDDYRKLLRRTKDALPDIQLIIGESYAIKAIKTVDEKWYPYFDEYRQAAKEIAAEFEAAFIPSQQLFGKAQEAAPGNFWSIDGIHPTPAGAKIMSEAWLKQFK